MTGIWKTEKDDLIDNLRIFDLRKVSRISELSGKRGTFVYLNSPDWVNIIPITKDHEIVLIEQFRHGTNEITLEIPGGMVEKSENPANAGMRECLEETGYKSINSPELLGKVSPNPAFLNNYCYSYLWNGVEKFSEQNLDGNEEISIKLASIDEVKKYIDNGVINHSLVLNALFFYFGKFGIR